MAPQESPHTTVSFRSARVLLSRRFARGGEAWQAVAAKRPFGSTHSVEQSS
jgi:hypothetical protein